jgi:hypothetical protein
VKIEERTSHGGARLRRTGRILIAIGVLAWLPYVILKYVAGFDVPVVPFLAVHLSGVVPGSILSRMKRHGE